VTCFKPELDVRYHRNAIASHSAQMLEAATVANVEELKAVLMPMIDVVEVVGIDEAQFFDASLLSLSNELMRLGHRVILAGLDTTFTGEPFAPIPDLMAIADEVTKLSAVCMQCGAPAVHTQRLGSNQALVLVGAAGVYEARCRACFRPWMDEHATEQLELPVSAGDRS
jgi:thymidine kinase